MVPPECMFCNHVNPANSKFCSQCGSPLHLMPCAQCGTINNLTTRKCRHCGADFPGRRRTGSPAVDPVVTLSQATLQPQFEPAALAEGASELEQLKAQFPSTAEAREASLSPAPVLLRRESAITLAGPRVAMTKRSTRRRSAVIVGAVVGVAFAGFYLYQQYAMVQERDLGAADAEWRRGASVGYRGSIGKPVPNPAGGTIPAAAASAAASPTLASSVEQAPLSVPPAHPASGQTDSILRGDALKKIEPPANEASQPVPLAAAVRGAGDKRATVRKAPDSAAAAALIPPPPVVRPNPAEAPTRLERPRLGPCTEAVAALGLCTPEPKHAAK
jgi:hypothetical protein